MKYFSKKQILTCLSFILLLSSNTLLSRGFWNTLDHVIQEMSSTVSKENIDNEIDKSIKEFFKEENINLYKIREKENYEIDKSKKYVKNKLKRKMRKEYRNYAKKDEIKNVVQKEFRDIANKIKRKNYNGWNLLADVITGVFSDSDKENYENNNYDFILDWDWGRDKNKKIYSHSLDSKIKEIVNKQLKKNGINHYEIPNKLKPEYYEKIQYITDGMKNLVNSWNHKKYVYEYEINNATQEILEPFIRNMSTVVLSKDLERTTRKEIIKELKLNGINEVPYNAKSIYDEDKRAIKNELNKIMNRDGRNYVRINEIEKTVKEELKPTINKINNYGSTYYTPPVNPYYVEPSYPSYFEEEVQPRFAGEICTVCQDSYFKQDRISELSCGHCFHEECINTWFATKESQGQKRSCPICRAKHNLITAKIYTNK